MFLATLHLSSLSVHLKQFLPRTAVPSCSHSQFMRSVASPFLGSMLTSAATVAKGYGRCRHGNYRAHICIPDVTATVLGSDASSSCCQSNAWTMYAACIQQLATFTIAFHR